MPPIEDSIISYKQWEETYRPIHADMIDFIDDVIKISPSPYHIWTVVDNNPNSVYLDVLAGYHLFNRLGFHVTEVPWTDKDMVVSNDPSYQR